MANEYNLGYDIFDSIMRAREVQCENIAKRLVELSNEYNLPIVILGKSYKPDVEYLEGSTTILTSYYVNKLGKDVEFDNIEYPAIYLLGHMGKYNNTLLPKGSIVLDVWREYKSKNIKVYYYG
jgi:UDPglucose 6-dehydrogenase